MKLVNRFLLALSTFVFSSSFDAFAEAAPPVDKAEAAYNASLEKVASVLKNGDVLLVRNSTRRENSTPGLWNHVAVVIVRENGAYVVEIQREKGCVASPAYRFLRRYPIYCVLRPSFECDRLGIARFAWSKVGQPVEYCIGASLAYRIEQDGPRENCVSFVRRSYMRSGKDFKWRIPDDIFNNRFRDSFRVVVYADETNRWREPIDKWEDLIVSVRRG